MTDTMLGYLHDIFVLFAAMALMACAGFAFQIGKDAAVTFLCKHGWLGWVKPDETGEQEGRNG